ncbi:MAG: sce7725 family protein [bacterium]
MYYPYLRGKQFELILLRDNAEFISKNNIYPIIEPVKTDYNALLRAIKILNENNVDFVLVVNPQVGEKPIDFKNFLQTLESGNFLKNSKLSIGYILNSKSKIKEIEFLFNKYIHNSFSIIHYGSSFDKEIINILKEQKNINRHIFIDGFAGKLYQRQFKGDGIARALIRNGFKAKKKNSDYPYNEHFSDLHVTYDDEGMEGFGDFLIVGDDYSETGGPAYAVAIHLTYIDNEDMFIYHFISDRTDSPTDPGGKFFEALEKLVSEVNKPNSLIFRSKACHEYLNLFKRKHYPGLGFIKKLSMQHHIELMADFLK